MAPRLAMLLVSRQITSAKPLWLLSAVVVLMASACDSSPGEQYSSNELNVADAAEPGMPTQSEPLTSSDVTLPEFLEAPNQADYNYDERSGWSYYYVAALNEDDKKRGLVSGSVSEFQYLGKNKEGEHVLAIIGQNGTVSYEAKCNASCRIIKYSDGSRIAYNTSSIIGAAFQDAIRGKLKIADWAKAKVVAPSEVQDLEFEKLNRDWKQNYERGQAPSSSNITPDVSNSNNTYPNETPKSSEIAVPSSE